MSLQTKFLGLMAALALAVVLNIATAVWAIGFLEQELSRPLRSIQPVLTGLHALERASDDQAAAAASLALSSADVEALRAYREATTRMKTETERLETLPFFDDRSGVGTLRVLQDRAGEIDRLGEAWLAGGEAEALFRELELMQRLVERVQARVIADAGEAATFGPQLRARMTVILVISVILTLSSIALGGLVVRRLVIRRVMQLREAAIRFGRGDLEHRTLIRGHDELATLGTEVNAMASTIAQMQAERVDRERLAAVGEMARRIVHNLRSPLAGIRSLAETTRDELSAESDLREVQERIIGTVDRFEVWLRELLRASAPLRVEPVRMELGPWIAGVVEGQRASAEGMGVRLELEDRGGPRFAMIDPRHLEHALVAVVSNAIEVTPRGGRVVVVVEREESRWSVAVRDEGPGVAPEAWSELYRPYFTTKPTGTGIGLAVAMAVARQHGGSIEATNLRGRGAEFRFVLPLSGRSMGEVREGELVGDDSGH